MFVKNITATERERERERESERKRAREREVLENDWPKHNQAQEATFKNRTRRRCVKRLKSLFLSSFLPSFFLLLLASSAKEELLSWPFSCCVGRKMERPFCTGCCCGTVIELTSSRHPQKSSSLIFFSSLFPLLSNQGRGVSLKGVVLKHFS